MKIPTYIPEYPYLLTQEELEAAHTRFLVDKYRGYVRAILQQPHGEVEEAHWEALKVEMAKREHLTNKVDRRKIRQEKAKK